MIFALAGNQNCGKTTLFNQLTGANQHVGNFPGVTVDQKTGEIRSAKDCSVVDLPGIYSIRPYTNEEIVTRDFILNEKPDGIINIVDATNIERNLYLTMQLMELNIPMFKLFDQLNNISYIQYTVQENESCCVFGSTFAELCAGKKNYKEVCKYLGIEREDAPILTNAYNSIKTSFPKAVSTIFCQDPNKIEQLTFKSYIPNLYKYLGYIYRDVCKAIKENRYNELRYCQEADNMIEIQKVDSYYDWMNKKQSKSFNDALKDMKDMIQKQGSAIARQQ